MNGSEPEAMAYVLGNRSVNLDDVGLDGHLLAVLLDPAADELFALVCDHLVGVQTIPTVDAPHEQIGLLPEHYRRMIAYTPIRCCRRTASGRPCRTPVAAAGYACAWHRDKRPAQ
ncbi:Uncharacterised protein [Mycobacteroides abscessus subsp. abscessus]|uniref:hypothetical protein n=1 Tax=Mycobacteroides abscessus TaxID=36809 RepID=UPI000926AAFD|nr:hypothetical protein [Mycobacteroides abscessus]SIE28579.1 Uncharacterised protein [Mycobacteroides abscessus subsp. abscessus]SKV14622.1 Uncharacterised protein [Mycobacteroides abscessus subsp. abscessus]